MHAHALEFLCWLHARYPSFSNGQSKTGTEVHWLSGLERVETPPSAPPSSVFTPVSPPVHASIPSRPPSGAHAGTPIASPRPVIAGPTSPLALSALSNHEVEELRAKVEDQAQTISQLRQEMQGLGAAAEQLKQLESRTSGGSF